jgi:tetratricopeptide (TPR) repeat protein
VVAQQPIYDYAVPIDTMSTVPDAAVADPAEAAFDQAREVFKAGDPNRALSLTDQALKSLPNDTTIHQFRAIVLFALKRYDEAAAVLYGVLSVGPGWDWTTLISLYADVNIYTAQLRALERDVDSHPNSAPARFVLAYLYLTQGQAGAAIGQYKAVLELQPQDRVSALIADSLTKGQVGAASVAANATTDAGPTTPVPTPSTPVANPQNEGKLEGTWTASPVAGTTITLKISQDNKFTWNFTANGQTRQLAGQFTSEKGVLSLVPAEDTAPPMVGQVTWQDPNHFVFQALGGGPGDKGLTFARTS